MVKNIDIIELTDASMIVPAYERALGADKSTILVEYRDFYNRE